MIGWEAFNKNSATMKSALSVFNVSNVIKLIKNNLIVLKNVSANCFVMWKVMLAYVSEVPMWGYFEVDYH